MNRQGQQDRLELLRYTQRELSRMTPKQRDILKILTNEADTWFTRKELAARLGKRYLQRHDIETLNKLEENFYVDVNKERQMDVLIRQGYFGDSYPRNFKGKNIALQSRYYSYRISPAYADLFEKLLLKKPKPQPKAASRPAAKPIAVYTPSLIERLMDKLGF